MLFSLGNGLSFQKLKKLLNFSKNINLCCKNNNNKTNYFLN